MKQWLLSDGAIYTDTSTSEENSVHIKYPDGREQHYRLLSPYSPRRFKGQTAAQFVQSCCVVNGLTITQEGVQQ